LTPFLELINANRYGADGMSTIHALIVDDDAYNLEILASLLDEVEVRCIGVQDPRNLSEILDDAGRIDVVFLDLELPGSDGYELLGILKNDFGLEAPIVAYTVHLSEAVQARRMGFDGFLGKPLDGTRFPDQLRRILNGETVWDTR
jgi:two-component system cell cycle response regulator DivK